ncbi:MAG: hypothetical protein NVSMB1_00730 [Polyangiales bacterium]
MSSHAGDEHAALGDRSSIETMVNSAPLTANKSSAARIDFETYVKSYFAEHPELHMKALGARLNRPSLDLLPFGHPVEFLDAATNAAWIAHYHRSNQAAFGGPLALPGWVLVDFYLMPGAIGMLTCQAEHLPKRHRAELGLHKDDQAIAAAYVATPCVAPLEVMGCSLISFSPSSGAARMIKALTLKMLKAKRQRGVAQWGNKSLWVHTRMGVLKLEGPVPASHERWEESFVYTVDLSDERRWVDALRGVRETDRFGSSDSALHASLPEPEWIPISAVGRLHDLLRRANEGEQVELLPPGLSSDGTHVFVRAFGGSSGPSSGA